MISREIEVVLRPQPQRHSRIGVVRADNVKNNEGREQEIRCDGKLQTAMPEEENDDKNDQQQIFQHPCLSVQRINRRNEPGHCAGRGQTQKNFSLQIHASINHGQPKRGALTNLARILVLTRPLNKHPQFVPRCLETFG